MNKGHAGHSLRHCCNLANPTPLDRILVDGCQSRWINRQGTTNQPERGFQQGVIQARIVPVQIATGDGDKPSVQIGIPIPGAVHWPNLGSLVLGRNPGLAHFG